jgi:hypothetical protein
VIVLDIDLDFFLSGIAARQAPRGQRLSEDLTPWSEAAVCQFLEGQCGLDSSRPVPGKFVEEHDAVFNEWRSLILAQRLNVPFDVVHVDAHADLGMGDGSWHYVSTDLLHRPAHARSTPVSGGAAGLNQGNFLLFAIACRWIRALTFVYHPDSKVGSGLRDIPKTAMKNYDVDGPLIQLKKLSAQTPAGIRPEDGAVIDLEPEVPWHPVAGADYKASAKFDFVFLTRSPRDPPPAADTIVGVVRQYMAVRHA